MVPGQVEQLATDLDGCQGHEVFGVGDRHRLHRAVEPDERLVDHVVGVVPAADAPEASQHAMGERLHSLPSDSKERLDRTSTDASVGLLQLMEEGRQPGSGTPLGHIHRCRTRFHVAAGLAADFPATSQKGRRYIPPQKGQSGPTGQIHARVSADGSFFASPESKRIAQETFNALPVSPIPEDPLDVHEEWFAIDR